MLGVKRSRGSALRRASIATLLLATCATVLQPARRPEFAANAGRVAVLPFSGPGGEQFSVEVSALLSMLASQRQTQFSVLDRRQLEAILIEARRSAKSIWNPRTRTRLRLLGAQTLLAGDILDNSVEKLRVRRRVRECVQSDGPFKCEKYRERTQYCTQVRASFRAVPRLTDVESGVVLYSNVLIGTANAEICPGSRDTVESVVARARDAALTELRMDVAPYPTTKLSFG